MKNLKALMESLRIAEENASKADAAWDENPDSEELERAFDIAYEEEFKAFEELAKAIDSVTAGKIDSITARTMIRKKRRELEQLISRMA